MKNKTKKRIRIAFGILLIVLVQAIGITYGRYISSEKGSGQAEIAKWAFEIVKDGQETKNINLTNTVDKDTLVDGKIAPGTSGSIIIAVDGTGSEVDLDYTINFQNEKNKPSNMTFISLGKEYKSLSEIKLSGNIKHDDINKVREVAVIWKWGYETGSTNEEKSANNKIDTEEASAITQYTFDVVATGTQCN